MEYALGRAKPPGCNDVKIHYPEKGWYNTLIISEFRGERKENNRKKQSKNGGI